MRARLGVLVTPTFLAYVTGGFAYGQVNRSHGFSAFTAANVPAGGIGGRAHGLDTGYAIGGGAEWVISNRVTLGAEYLHVDRGAANFTTTSDTLNGIGTCAPVACRFKINSGGSVFARG